jgi:hypothetical protein
MKSAVAIALAAASLLRSPAPPQDTADPAAVKDLLQAGLAESQTKWRAALDLYRKHLRHPALGDEATLGELRCITALADFRALKARAAELLPPARGKRAVNPRVLIAAYTARGDVETNGGQLKEALFDYLHGAFVHGRGETSREHELSVARSALACLKVASAEADPARKATFRGRSRELLQELLRNYPSSPYKKEIEQALR